MARTDRCSPTGLLVRCSCSADFPFIRSRVGAPNGNTEQSLHTSVLCDEIPVHQSRSQA